MSCIVQQLWERTLWTLSSKQLQPTLRVRSSMTFPARRLLIAQAASQQDQWEDSNLQESFTNDVADLQSHTLQSLLESCVCRCRR